MTGLEDEFFKLLGRDNFAKTDNDKIPTLARDEARRITIYVERQTIAPFIDRSDTPDETITHMLDDGTEIVEVPARKFKSKEKLLAIRLCKMYGAIDPAYRYNAVQDTEHLKNPASVLFGDTMVKSGRDNQAMFPSRALYSSNYSIQNKDRVTQRLMHNALSELGTMWDPVEGKHRQSLFETEYVVPGTIFPSFIVLKDPTPGLLYLLLRSLSETSYGAQTSITGPNFRNRVLAVLASKYEPPVSSFTAMQFVRAKLKGSSGEGADFGINDTPIEDISRLTLDYVTAEFDNFATRHGGKSLHGTDLNLLFQATAKATKEDVEKTFAQLKADSEALWEYSYSKKEPKKGKLTAKDKE